MLQKLISKYKSFKQNNKQNLNQDLHSCLNTEFLEQGIAYNFKTILSQNLSELFYIDIKGNSLDKEKFSLLCSMVEEEKALVTLDNQAILLPWQNIYSLIEEENNDAEYYNNLLEFLDIPKPAKNSNIKPVINCHNNLSDKNFTLFIEYWSDNERKYHNAKTIGACLSINQQKYLMQSPYFDIAQKINEHNKIEFEHKSQNINEEYWGVIRALAIKSNAKIASEYLKSSIILTPKNLKFEFNKVNLNNINQSNSDFDNNTVTEISPTFDNAPNNWLKQFDSYEKVQNHYDCMQDNTRTRIILSPAVKQVLSNLKQIMPKRKVAGNKAQAFMQNPWALLGEESHTIIDEKQFEQAKQKAEIYSSTFTLKANISYGNIENVDIEISTIISDDKAVTNKFTLNNIDDLEKFLHKLNQRINQNYQLMSFKEYDLTIDAETQNILDEGLYLLHIWKNQSRNSQNLADIISFEDIYLFEDYAQRIANIGIHKPICIPFLAKNNQGQNNSSWLPDDLLPCLAVNIPPKNDKVILPLEKPWLEEIKQKVKIAEQDNKLSISDDKIPYAIPIVEAKQIIQQLENYFQPNNDKYHQENIKLYKIVKESLLIKHNFEKIDYTEQRANLLDFKENTQSKIPKCLRKHLELYPHQHHGVAWLQNLIQHAPESCRGALLADDMGLGKTLQILIFLAKYYEDNPNTNPSLILAPVSLMQNWQNEANKYFDDNFPQILCLYDKDLKQRKLDKNCIDKKLQEKGIDSLLKPNWLGNAKIVLTTYETMANYEFSFARQAFSIMICDEAQKIKTPNTNITRVAKAQNVLFKIACTGTPVENSLVDLWCLFDFIQPSLLGQLNEFNKKYRKPIEATTDEQKNAIEELRKLIHPQILRRMKSDIKSINLPKKEYSKDELKISQYQHNLYCKEINYLNEANQEQDIKRRAKISFGVLHAIKAICAEPYCMPTFRFKLDEEGKEIHKIKSPKINWLIQKLQEIQHKQEKVIIFTEIRQIQDAITYFVKSEFNLNVVITINGDNNSQNRQDLVDKFSEVKGFNVIILSPLAAGCGLNIISANHVIHFTRTWNPAKEAQATDRAYRIGQNKDVYVYTPTIISDEFITFEKKLDELLSKRRDLSNDMLDGIGDDINTKDLMPTHDINGYEIENKVLTIYDVDKLDKNGLPFEKFCALLYQKQGYAAYTTPKIKGGDGGVDVVVISEHNKTGFLIQCKHSFDNKKLGWEAVQNVMGGFAIYEKKYHDILFTAIIFTNQYFNATTHERAMHNKIQVVERNHIIEFLENPNLYIFDNELRELLY